MDTWSNLLFIKCDFFFPQEYGLLIRIKGQLQQVDQGNHV